MEFEIVNVDTALVPASTGKLNKSYNVSAIQRGQATAASGYVPHISVEDVRRLAAAAGGNQRTGDRDALMIRFIFDGCFRVSEALSVRPADLSRNEYGWTVRILGKGNKPRAVAISSSMAAEIQAYCYQKKIKVSDRIFTVSRSRVFGIVSEAFEKSGVPCPTKKRDRVGAVHVLRHSGAIERLRVTGNPKAVQDQLGHATATMTLRYFKTLSAEESLRINQGVDLW